MLKAALMMIAAITALNVLALVLLLMEALPAPALLGGLCVIDILITIGLIVWFQSKLRARLALLVENAERLPTGVPLRPLGGSDELAQLDGAMHKASSDLRRLSEHRQSLMEMVAHDLKAPLAATQVSLDILSTEKAGVLTAMQRKQVEAARHNVHRTVGLINDLLTVDRLEAGSLQLRKKDVDLATLASQAVESVAPLAKLKNVELVSDAVHQIVQADPERLVQVMVNLLSNAIHFSPHNSMVELRAAVEGKDVRVSVRDQGPGVVPDAQGKLFDKFYQASGKSKIGFGVGLSICKHIVRLHQGDIGVNSEPGRGSEFWFTLPRG